MSTLDQFIAEGRQEGIALGKAEGQAEGKQLAAKILKLYLKGSDAVTIAAQLAIACEFVEQTIADYEAA